MEDSFLLELTGQSQTHVKLLNEALVFGKNQLYVHQDIVTDLLGLAGEVEKEGVHLSVVSSFRSYERQRMIWNDKVVGKRPVVDNDGNIISLLKLSSQEKIFTILNWSALPGLSRHHWGTDIDIIDGRATEKDYQVVLTLKEAEEKYFHLHSVVEKKMHAYNFFKPYAYFKGGVHKEPWHLSHRAIAQKYFDALTIDCVTHIIEGEENLLMKNEILQNIDIIYSKYIKNICF